MAGASPDRGVVYIVWGEYAEIEARRSIASAEQAGLAWHLVVRGSGACLADKAEMHALSPFTETLFLDSDTVVVGDLGFGFEMAARHGLAITIAPACYARRQPKTRGDLVEYNTGVIFFKRSDEVQALFKRWRTIVREYGRNDQWGFAQAVYDTGFNPFVLPQNWNLRPDVVNPPFFGPIKVWHSRAPVPSNLAAWNGGPLGFGVVRDNQIEPYVR